MATDKGRNRVTKELAMAITPVVAAFLFIAFYEAGAADYYSIPTDLITVNFTDVLLTNRLTLMVAVIAFLWIGLYYDMLPSAGSPVFKGMITLILILALWLGFLFGRNDAKTKQDYMVYQDPHKEMVVLKIYADKMIMAPLLRHTQGFRRSFKIIPLTQSSEILLHLEDVGPLTPQ